MPCKKANKPARKKAARKRPDAEAKQPSEKSWLETEFARLWGEQVKGWEFEREWRFHPTRKWRFDFAWPGQKLAVECHGGGRRGRHTRWAGFNADCEKHRSAVELGWRVLPFTTADFRKDRQAIIDQVRRVLGA